MEKTIHYSFTLYLLNLLGATGGVVKSLLFDLVLSLMQMLVAIFNERSGPVIRRISTGLLADIGLSIEGTGCKCMEELDLFVQSKSTRNLYKTLY